MPDAQRSVLREGVVAGLIGAAVVAVWYFVFDIARGKPLLTPTLLGAFVFQHATALTDVDNWLLPILGYTILHGLAFISFGVVAASLIAVSEREKSLFVAFVILFAAVLPDRPLKGRARRQSFPNRLRPREKPRCGRTR